MNDDFDIPDFLRRPMTPAIAQRLDQLTAEYTYARPLLATGDASVDWLKPKGVTVEEWAVIKARREHQQKEKHKIHATRSKLRQQERIELAKLKIEAREAKRNGARWDYINNRWTTTQEVDDMPKWIITPYLSTETDGISVPNKRAKSSVKEGADRAELSAKIIAVVLRSGKRTVKAEVSDSSGALLSTWAVKGEAIIEGSDSFPLVAASKEESQGVSKKAKTKKTSGKKLNGGPGVIETIVKFISRDRGGTIDEIVEHLKGVFPDRKVSSMTFTAKKQAYLNAKSKERDEKRGLVYYGTK